MQSSDGLEDNVSSDVVDKKDAKALFSPSDILWMTRHEIDSVRSASKQILTVAGTKITLFQGQSIGKMQDKCTQILKFSNYSFNSGEVSAQEVCGEALPTARG